MTTEPFYTARGREKRLAQLYIAIIAGQAARGAFDIAEAQGAAMIAMRGLNDLMLAQRE